MRYFIKKVINKVKDLQIFKKKSFVFLYKSVIYNMTFVGSLIFFNQSLESFFQKNPLSTSSFLGFSIQEPIKNTGFIFGFQLKEMSLFLHMILVAICLLFSFYYFIFILFSSRKEKTLLQISISFLFAGWLSNFLNKLSQLYVLDYIKWEIFRSITIYFNLADMFQTVGWFLLILQIIYFRKQIWREYERRKKLLVLKKLQYQFLAYCSFIFVLLSVFFILLIQKILTVLELSNNPLIKEISHSFLVAYFFSLFFLYFFFGLFFIYISNKIYGPIYAFERYIREILEGKNTEKDFHLRKGDQFKHLEKLAKDIKKKLSSSS
ncbi:MAG: signal peptidase II [Bdellovibrionales bacterium]|nr:signal peptidase II [Bdellovibrionales bacterium]